MNHDSDYGGGSGAQSRCVPDVGTAEALWSDRDYAWIDAPGDILRGGWTYYIAPLDPAAGAPCPNRGGFRGTLSESATVAICCANHCGLNNEQASTIRGVNNVNTQSLNQPTGADSWSEHPGSFAVSGHDGQVSPHLHQLRFQLLDSFLASAAVHVLRDAAGARRLPALL